MDWFLYNSFLLQHPKHFILHVSFTQALFSCVLPFPVLWDSVSCPRILWDMDWSNHGSNQQPCNYQMKWFTFWPTAIPDKKKKKYARKMPMEVKNEVRSMVTFYFYMLDSVYGINVVTTGFGKSRWWQP